MPLLLVLYLSNSLTMLILLLATIISLANFTKIGSIKKSIISFLSFELIIFCLLKLFILKSHLFRKRTLETLR